MVQVIFKFFTFVNYKKQLFSDFKESIVIKAQIEPELLEPILKINSQRKDD